MLFLVNFIGRSFTPILPLHLADLGVARRAAGLGHRRADLGVLARRRGLGLAARPAQPRRTRRAALLLATLVGGAAVVVAPMALVPSFELVLGLAVLLGLVSGGSLTLCYTIGGLMVPEAVRTTAFGFFSGAALFGGAVSPSVARASWPTSRCAASTGSTRRSTWPWPRPSRRGRRCRRCPTGALALESPA